MYIRWFGIFQTSKYQCIVKATVFWVFEDLNWDSQQGRLRTASILVRAFWNFKHKVLKYFRTCSLHSTLIPSLVKPLAYKHAANDPLMSCMKNAFAPPSPISLFHHSNFTAEFVLCIHGTCYRHSEQRCGERASKSMQMNLALNRSWRLKVS